MLRRYATDPMMQIWGEPSDDDALRHRYGMWLKVLLSSCEERVMMGVLTAEECAAITEVVGIDIERIATIEATRKHDFAAFIQSLHEQLDAAGLGHLKPHLLGKLGSYDVEDPACMAMIHSSLVLIESEAKGVASALSERAVQHKLRYMMGRTHGQFAMPTTFGHLLLVYAMMMRRNVRRLNFCVSVECAEASMAGDVGNYAGMDPSESDAFCRAFQFEPAIAETQIVQRDRHAMIMVTLAVVAASIQHIAETFWIMMHGCVGELQEPFGKGQRGSVAMPQKKNPIVTEQLKGMPRLVYGDALAALLNVATPEDRDISQSNVERHIFPDSLTQVHYMLGKLEQLVRTMVVKADGMMVNINRTFGTWAGQRLRDALIEAGVDHDAAYDYVQRCSSIAMSQQAHLREAVGTQWISDEDTRTAGDILSSDSLVSVFDIPSFVNPGIEHMFRRAGLSEDTPKPS